MRLLWYQVFGVTWFEGFNVAQPVVLVSFSKAIKSEKKNSHRILAAAALHLHFSFPLVPPRQWQPATPALTLLEKYIVTLGLLCRIILCRRVVVICFKSGKLQAKRQDREEGLSLIAFGCAPLIWKCYLHHHDHHPPPHHHHQQQQQNTNTTVSAFK